MNKKIYHGWYIVGAGVIILAFMWTLPMSCFSLFITPITKEMNFAKASFGLCSTIVSLVSMLASPFISKLLVKANVKIVMSISALMVAGGFIGYSFSHTLPMFYISAFFIGLGLNGSSIMAISLIVKNWFIEKRGLATSIALAGSGVGGMIFSPLVNSFISNLGWRSAYRILAVLIAIIILPIILIIVQKKPEDRGLKPLGFGEEHLSSNKEKEGINIPVKSLRKKPVFIVYCLSTVLTGFAVGGVLIQANSYLVTIWDNPTLAANVVAIFLAIAVPGKIILGALYDKKGSVAGVVFGCVTFFLSSFALIFAHQWIFLILFTVLYGFGTCNGTVTPSVLTSKLFGSTYYGEIFGTVNIFSQLGVAIATPILGAIFDVTRSYQYAWVLCTVLGVLSLIGYLYCIATTRKMEQTTVKTATVTAS